MVEKQFFGQIAGDATDALVCKGVDEALSRERIEPLCGFEYEGEKEARRGHEFRFSVKFCVLDTIAVPSLEDMHIKEEEPQADPVQEELFLREILGRGAGRISVREGFPQDGDIVLVEVTGKMDGRVVQGMRTGECRMRLMPVRPGENPPDLDPIIRHLRPGETGCGTTPCPDNYPDPSMRGKNIDLTVTLKSIEREKLPPLTDETARILGFSHANALRASAHARALEMDRVRRYSETKRILHAKLEEWENVNPPEALVYRFRRESLQRSRRYLQSQFDTVGKLKETLSQMRDEAGEKACGKARARVILLSFAQQQNITVDEKVAFRVLAARAARNNMEPEAYRKSLARSGGWYEILAAMREERAEEALMKRVYRP